MPKPANPIVSLVRSDARPQKPVDLEALKVQERAHTIRLAICAAAAFMMLGSLIPIANARPRFGSEPTD